jgi:AraC-like DNA-binding protein
MDALSDVLRAVRLTGAVFFDVRAAAPWAAATPSSRTIAKRVFPETEHLIPYHVLHRGRAFLSVDGGAPIALTAGDIVVVPHGAPHVLSSAPGLRTKPDLKIYRPPKDQSLPFALDVGHGHEESAQLVCGYLGCDAGPFNPLLGALPPLIKLENAADSDLPTYLNLARQETAAARPGGQCALSLLSELLFVDVIRRYLERLPSGEMNWLAGLRDPYVGRALTALHGDPTRDWNLPALARVAGLSRSALAERFAQFIGRPPMQYLASWRMQIAANQLRTGSDNVATIAARVGYDSEAAFSRAFKKAVGATPKAWRERTAPPSAA